MGEVGNCGRNEEWWEKQWFMRDVINRRSNGLWDMGDMATEEMDCGRGRGLWERYCRRSEEWWEKEWIVGVVRHGGRRNGLWEGCSIVGEAGSCGRSNGLWEMGYMATEEMDCGRSRGLWEGNGLWEK